MSLPASAAATLEAGGILRLDPPGFVLLPAEQALIAAARIGGDAKNISYDRGTGELRHVEGAAADLATLIGLLDRFAAFCESALAELLPEYAGGISAKRTSFRPVEIAGRSYSWRRDDRMRHVDAFPSSPTGGRRILRMFCNADQSGRPRIWHTGPDFEDYVEALWPQAAIRCIPGIGAISALLGITKGRRTRYDARMLALHDAAKRNRAWQANTPAQIHNFLPGETWLVYTDLVPHAAISGCNALEQTFLVDETCLVQPDRSPLAVLSRRTGQDMHAAI